MERLSRLHGEGEGGMKSRSLLNYGNSKGTESLDSAINSAQAMAIRKPPTLQVSSMGRKSFVIA
jgi:hypothetical protein